MITVALAKGALLKDSVARFAAAGLDFSAVLDKNNRQLMVPTPCGRARALLVRNGDVPTYVAYGQAQLPFVQPLAHRRRHGGGDHHGLRAPHPDPDPGVLEHRPGMKWGMHR